VVDRFGYLFNSNVQLDGAFSRWQFSKRAGPSRPRTSERAVRIALQIQCDVDMKLWKSAEYLSTISGRTKGTAVFKLKIPSLEILST
jgi:hypothetical protein